MKLVSPCKDTLFFASLQINSLLERFYLMEGGECKGKEDPNSIRGNEHRRQGLLGELMPSTKPVAVTQKRPEPMERES